MIIELVELVAVEPAEPVRKYYLALIKGDPVPNLRVQTDERFEVDTPQQKYQGDRQYLMEKDSQVFHFKSKIKKRC